MSGSIGIGVYNIDSLLFECISRCCNYIFFEKNINYTINNLKSIPNDNSYIDILIVDIENLIPSIKNNLKNYSLKYKTSIITIADNFESLLFAFEIHAFRNFKFQDNENTIMQAIIDTVDNIIQTKKILINTISNTIITVNDILYVEALGNESIFVTSTNTFISNKNLKYWQTKLEPMNFFRCHKSYLVYLDNIQSLNENNIIFKNTKCNLDVIVSRRKKTRLKLLLKTA